jgi:hypothetical protein
MDEKWETMMEPPLSALAFEMWLIEQCRLAPTLDFDPLSERSRSAWDYLRRLPQEEQAQALQGVKHYLDARQLPPSLVDDDPVVGDCFIRLLALIVNPPPLI